VARIAVTEGQGEMAAVSDRPQRQQQPGIKSLKLERELSGLPPPAKVEVTVVTDPAPFEQYQRAGELVEVYSRLEAGTYYVSNVFLVVFIGFLLSVIAGALVVGMVMSRRVTRRVNMLAEATARVGSGDLSVELPADSRDEIGDLTRAFNEMVRDIRESRERIEYLQRISAWQEFARRLAHEIKNPLTPIQLAMQEVHQGYRGEDERYRARLDEALSIVEEEVATLRRLVGEFSKFARLPEVRLEPADLNDVLRDCARTATGVDEEPGADDLPGPEVSVELELGSSPLPVRVDAMMFKRCIDNLVRNSRQAIAGRSRKGEAGAKEEAGIGEATESRLIRISSRQARSWAVLEVEDSGSGIPQSDRNRVFDPYFTTRTEGTGLGLAIVKKVVLEHGGEIECDQSRLGGALFRIRLPLNR
jgi:nitrogen fixation/metabolism regulation signal transduction histidine kinase